MLAAMDSPSLDRETFHALDARFHVLLSALAGNAVIEAMMDSLSGAIRDYVTHAMDAITGWPEVLRILRSQHHAIFDAVISGEGERAARLLREHIEWFYRQASVPEAAG